MSWQDNAIMFWSFDDGTTWEKVTDHNRGPLDISYERIGASNRMVDGTLRRQKIAKKRKFDVNWEMLPSKRNALYAGKNGLTTVDGGLAGEEIEQRYEDNDGKFLMKLRAGSDEAKAASDGTIEIVNVMFTDFSKAVQKRGIVDFWQVNLSLEEV